jgi:hypothetical protein
MSPLPQDELKGAEYGLITPDGEFYSCGYAGHYALAFGLTQSGKLNINETHGHYGAVHVSGFEFDNIYKGYRVTQAQLDTMFDYAMLHGLKFNAETLKVE